jgi:glycosyltransferase involved in cell wall biosynthesis
MAEPLRVAYTLEQCWHDVPGGTAVASLKVLEQLVDRDDVVVRGVAGRHRRLPEPSFRPPIDVATVPLARPWLYMAWNRFGWPRIDTVTGPVDVTHSTIAIPAAAPPPHVVTVHDVAFVHTPERFTRHGAKVMRDGLERCRRAELVLCPTRATADALGELGFDRDRVRIVPWGVEPVHVGAHDVTSIRFRLDLPERFVLFVGTIEPRKNLPALATAVSRLDEPLPLVVAGADGWGDVRIDAPVDVRFLGFVPHGDLHALYAAASVFAYPSLEEGFGMPILEAMVSGAPVVTSRGGATEEAAGGAAVLVDPHEPDSIAEGLVHAMRERDVLVGRGRERAAASTWAHTADLTVAAYREVAR